MERELWPLLYRTLDDVANAFSQKYVQIHPKVLVAVYLWAALHDRPVAWACDARNWATTALRPLRLPSAATMSRRVYSVGVGLLFRALAERLRRAHHPALVAFLDGKPLPVGGYTKDPDAGYGHGAGLAAKGYKLHAVWSTGPVPDAWDVTALNVGETTAAGELLDRLAGPGGYLVGDGNYDASHLFDRAHRAGYQLVVPITKPNPGRGHHYQSPHRKRRIAMQPGVGTSAFGAGLLAARSGIERAFGNAAGFAGGLGPLPAWVRRRWRVRAWVWAKLLINAVRIIKKQGLTASLQ